MSAPVLEMRNIKKSFGATQALGGVSFTVERGEVHMLLGENGAGKSTLMKILAGSLAADSGEIFWEGHLVDIGNPSIAHKMGIGMVYQELALVDSMSVMENINLGNMPTTGKTRQFVDWKAVKERARNQLARVGLQHIDMSAQMSKFGVGVQQLVEIAKALEKNAKLVILDEPTSALTKTEVDTLFSIINNLTKEGISFVFITHKLEEVFRVGSRVSILRDGMVVGETKQVSDVVEADLISGMVGREITEFYPKEDNLNKQGEGNILEVAGLGHHKYFHDVNLNVRHGEILGMFGLVGSGCTEIAEALFGLIRPENGSIKYLGKDYVPHNPKKSLLAGIGMVVQDRKQSLLLHMPIYCSIALSNMIDFVKYKILRLRKKEIDNAGEYANKVQLRMSSVLAKANSLSGGNQQKVALSRLLCANCKLFIMDDPTRGIDVGAKVEVYKLLNNLTAAGCGVILISSQLPELLGMADRIAVASDGTIVDILDAKNSTQEQIMTLIAGGARV